jgi:glutamate-ammonia-ligase adenylyltransferase
MLSPSQKLHLEFETRAATIRAFVESHLGRDSIPGPPAGNAADLVLALALPEELKQKILLSGGLTDLDKAFRNVTSLAGEGETRNLFARLAILAWDFMRRTPDPDMALNNWERFARSRENRWEHYNQLLSQPKQLEILLDIFAGSQFLADTLAKNPEFLTWVSDPGHLHRVRRIDDIEEELQPLLSADASEEEWLNTLRRLRRKEILRIGTRDICLNKPILEIFRELTNLAEALLRSALKKRWQSVFSSETDCCSGFCVLAYGKLGGRELNYSSDIDLLGVFDPAVTRLDKSDFEKKCTRTLELAGKDLSGHTEEGYAYRVDYRLRPFGRAGSLVHSRAGIVDYFKNSASLWEHQALLRLRPVAGDEETGQALLSDLKPLLIREWNREEVARTIHELRSKAAKTGSLSSPQGVDVKNGIGGIRDIEFLLQGLQLIHCRSTPEILSGNTYEGLGMLGRCDILPAEAVTSLQEDYIFLRRVEHFLQIFEDRQTHTLPKDAKQREALAKRISRGGNVDEVFMNIEKTMSRVRDYYTRYLQIES